MRGASDRQVVGAKSRGEEADGGRVRGGGAAAGTAQSRPRTRTDPPARRPTSTRRSCSRPGRPPRSARPSPSGRGRPPPRRTTRPPVRSPCRASLRPSRPRPDTACGSPSRPARRGDLKLDTDLKQIYGTSKGKKVGDSISIENLGDEIANNTNDGMIYVNEYDEEV